MSAPYKDVDHEPAFPALELNVLERWRERDIFHESIRRREGCPSFVFYEGPPTANGRPGSHHVLSRVFKDVFPRYKTMRGHVVHRKAGWDCHGLPVELEIERELGIASKADIERYGVAEFNARCRESVFAYIDEWNRLTERIGFWIDTDDAYVTMSDDYIESVWWSLREVWRQGRLYERYKVVPYCPRCGTALSSHEVAQGYRDVVDPSVYVRFPVRGEDDVRLGEKYGLTVQNPVRPDGTFDERMGPFAGRGVKDADPDVVEALRESGRLFRVEEYEHAYPHCWRCGTALLYYAKQSWYVRTTAVRDQMLAENEKIRWYPEHIKHGRFGDWLANNVDWALSRERYWGTPLPVWRCPEGHTYVAGSFADLAKRSGRALTDHHRPFVDELELRCEGGPGGGPCGQPMRRVAEVIDVWFDSGAMPFAQHHFPYENEAVFRERFPADFVCEAQDQTRGWFYSLLAVATLLGLAAPYRNVVCLGLILDEEGQKMSKSRGNTVEPWSVLDTYGADAFRWYFFTAKSPWDGYRFSAATIGEGVRLFLKQLWSTYFFYVLYAHAGADQLQHAQPGAGSRDALDRWALSRTAATAEFV